MPYVGAYGGEVVSHLLPQAAPDGIGVRVFQGVQDADEYRSRGRAAIQPGVTPDIMEPGYFATTNEKEAKGYAGKKGIVRKGTVNVQRPFNIHTDVQGFVEVGKRLGLDKAELIERAQEKAAILKEDSSRDRQSTVDLWGELKSMIDAGKAREGTVPGHGETNTAINAAIEAAGYDGMVYISGKKYPGGRNDDVYVYFDPKQFVEEGQPPAPAGAEAAPATAVAPPTDIPTPGPPHAPGAPDTRSWYERNKERVRQKRQQAVPVAPDGQAALPGMEIQAAEVEERDRLDRENKPELDRLERLGGATFSRQHAPILRNLAGKLRESAATQEVVGGEAPAAVVRQELLDELAEVSHNPAMGKASHLAILDAAIERNLKAMEATPVTSGATPVTSGATPPAVEKPATANRQQRIATRAQELEPLGTDELKTMQTKATGVEREAIAAVFRDRGLSTLGETPVEKRGRETTESLQAAERDEAKAQQVSEQFDTADAYLREQGWGLEHTSESGSRYYIKDGERLRVADHTVPHTPERNSGSFSWADSANQILLPASDLQAELGEMAPAPKPVAPPKPVAVEKPAEPAEPHPDALDGKDPTDWDISLLRARAKRLGIVPGGKKRPGLAKLIKAVEQDVRTLADSQDIPMRVLTEIGKEVMPELKTQVQRENALREAAFSSLGTEGKTLDSKRKAFTEKHEDASDLGLAAVARDLKEQFSDIFGNVEDASEKLHAILIQDVPSEVHMNSPRVLEAALAKYNSSTEWQQATEADFPPEAWDVQQDFIGEAKKKPRKRKPAKKKPTKKQEAANERVDAALANVLDKLGNLGNLGAVYDPKVVADQQLEVTDALVEVVRAYIAKGFATFDAFWEEFKGNLGAKADANKPLFEYAWKQVKDGDDIVSIKNRIIDEIRARRGAEPLWGTGTKSHEQMIEEGFQQLQLYPSLGADLVASQLRDPKNLSDVDTAVLQIYYRQKTSLYNKAADNMEKTFAAGDAKENMILEREAEALWAEMEAIQKAARTAGTEWHLTGKARQIELLADFSLAALTRRAAVSNGGKQPSKEQRAIIKETAETDEQLAEDLEESEAADEKAEVTRGVDEVIEKAIEENKKEKAKKKAAKKKPAKRKPAKKQEAARKKISDGFAEMKKAMLDINVGMAAGGVPIPAGLLKGAAKVVSGYIELNVATFAEMWADFRESVGSDAETLLPALRAEWARARSEGETPQIEIDSKDKEAVTRFARKIARALVTAGVTNRDAVVKGVHEELSQFMEIDIEGTEEALSAYGQFLPLTRNDIEDRLREIYGELKQTMKLRDMRRRTLRPKASGREMPAPAEVERGLIKEVHEEKKNPDLKDQPGSRPLKSALDSAKTAISNRLRDMTKEIEQVAKIVKNRRDVTADADLTEMRRRKEVLQSLYDAAFPRAPLTLEQRTKKQIKALDTAIRHIREDIETGKISPQPKPEQIKHPVLQLQRMELEAFRKLRAELRLLANPKATKEQRETATYERKLTRQAAHWERRLAEEDFVDPKRVKKVRSKATLEIMQAKENNRINFRNEQRKWKEARWHPARKVAESAWRTVNTLRSLVVSGDGPPMFRQAGMVTMSHPKLSTRAAGTGLSAWRSDKKGLQAAIQSVRDAPRAHLYQQIKLAITEVGGEKGVTEEPFMNSYSEYIWGVAMSERIYVTYLNKVRSDLFELLADNLTGAEASIDELTAIANYVNNATGRGNLTGLETSANTLAEVFFSPRYLASRVHLMLGTPIWTAPTWRVKRLIMQEYFKAGLGLAIFSSSIMLALAARAAASGDDDDWPSIGLDPTATSFGKIRIGDSRLDLLSGMSQALVLPWRVLGGTVTSSSGKQQDIRGDDVPYGGVSGRELTSRFLWYKASPIISQTWNFLDGKNMVGEKWTIGSAAIDATIPLLWRDVKEVFGEQDADVAVFLTVLATFGAGLQTYEDYKPKRKKRSATRGRTKAKARGR
jgi:hypothetical protein